MSLRSEFVRDVEKQSLRLFPAETRIGDGFAVLASCDRLGAVLDVALDEKAADVAAYALVVAYVVDDLFDDADLFDVIFAAVAVIGVDDDTGFLSPCFSYISMNRIKSS